MIGWLILAVVLVPALALGRWAEHERRRGQTRVHADAAPSVVARRRHIHAPGRPRRASGTPARAESRAPVRRSRTYAGR